MVVKNNNIINYLPLGIERKWCDCSNPRWLQCNRKNTVSNVFSRTQRCVGIPIRRIFHWWKYSRRNSQWFAHARYWRNNGIYFFVFKTNLVYSIGSNFNNTFIIIIYLSFTNKECLPIDKMKIIFGAWTPSLVIDLINSGMDIFDSTFPHLTTERNCALIFGYNLSYK